MPEASAVKTLDDVRRLLKEIPGPDEAAGAHAREREPRLTKPQGSLGRLERLSEWLSAWQGRHPPRIRHPFACVFAGNHGVARRGVSAFPAEVTAQMVANFEVGGAAVNQLCKTFGVSLRVEAMTLEQPTLDFTQAPAMSEAECAQAVAFGFSVVNKDMDVLCLGEMGIGNTTSAAALCHALYGATALDWAGPGTGVGGEALAKKVAIIDAAVALHRDEATDAVDILRRLGGRELAAIIGAVLAARLKRVPVLLDGYVCTAAAAVLETQRQGALDHCQVGHVSAEPGHCRLLERLGKTALLNLDMRLGEASGAVLAVELLRAAAACHGGMATFSEAEVSLPL